MDSNQLNKVLPSPDPLGVLSTTLPILYNAEFVHVDQQRVQDFAIQWPETPISPDYWDQRYHFFDGSQKTLNWILLLDALNFCFWSPKDTPRWTITYQGEVLNGYLAEAAALKRAVEEGHPLWEADYLATMPAETLAHIFRGEQMIPLFARRLTHTHEIGRILLSQYEGQFSRMLTQAGGSAIQLAQLLAQTFTSFRDETSYQHQTIRFWKRAQICVADLYGAFEGKGWGSFSDLDQLTIFADYKLPQILRACGLLVYAPTLATRVDAYELIPAGSAEEVEIRAATIWACELLRQALAARGRVVTAAQIDTQLWLLSQDYAPMQPYHRTLTWYY